MQMKYKTLSILLTIILISIPCGKLSANKSSGVSVKQYNELVIESNQCKEILFNTREKLKDNKEIIEKVIYKDKIIIEENKAASDAAKKQGRLEGALFAGGIGIILIVLMVLV